MWELDREESWAPKNWCFWTVVLEKTLESPLGCKEIQLQGDQPWDFFGGNDAEAETPVLWPPHVKSWLIGKTLMLGGIGSRRRRGLQRMRWLDGITDSMDMNLSNLFWLPSVWVSSFVKCHFSLWWRCGSSVACCRVWVTECGSFFSWSIVDLHYCVDSLEKTLMLGGIGGKRRRGLQRMRWLDGITDSMDVYRDTSVHEATHPT